MSTFLRFVWKWCPDDDNMVQCTFICTNLSFLSHISDTMGSYHFFMIGVVHSNLRIEISNENGVICFSVLSRIFCSQSACRTGLLFRRHCLSLLRSAGWHSSGISLSLFWRMLWWFVVHALPILPMPRVILDNMISSIRCGWRRLLRVRRRVILLSCRYSSSSSRQVSSVNYVVVVSVASSCLRGVGASAMLNTRHFSSGLGTGQPGENIVFREILLPWIQTDIHVCSLMLFAETPKKANYSTKRLVRMSTLV